MMLLSPKRPAHHKIAGRGGVYPCTIAGAIR